MSRWTGVLWSDLTAAEAEAVIEAQVSRFAELGRPWEWKHYSYDQPARLPELLRAAGLVPEPAETLLVADIADLDVDVPAPAGVDLVPVTDDRGVAAVVAYRARLARERGYRYLQVDATDDSSPILQRLGFAELARTTPFVHPGRGMDR